MTAPPDYIGVGTQGAGIGWWHGLLLEHPAIRGPEGGEPALQFFGEFATREMTAADVARYHAHFPRREGSITGEWSPRYGFDAWTPALLHAAAPEARLLMLVCDPIERYRARLARQRREAESEDEVLYMSDAAARGRYATQLRALRAYFDPERILVLQIERCRRDPLGEYARTLRFLGVREDFVPRRFRHEGTPIGAARRGLGHAARALGVPADLERPGLRGVLHTVLHGRDRAQAARRHAAAAGPRRRARAALWPDIEEPLHVDLDPEVAALAEMVPEFDLRLWRNFRAVARRAPTP